jgi:hypothetical protein
MGEVLGDGWIVSGEETLDDELEETIARSSSSA